MMDGVYGVNTILPQVILYGVLTGRTQWQYYRAMAKKTRVPRSDEFLHMRISKQSKEILQKAAVSAGISLTAWATMTLLASAKKLLMQEGK